jgi:hypothetical protein
MNELRDLIAAAIGGVDDWRSVTDPAILADAVIAELQPELAHNANERHTNE